MDEIAGPKAEALIANLLVQPETTRFESKRLSGKMVGKALEAICAFANTAGGTLALGLEDLAKVTGPERLHGLEENPEPHNLWKAGTWLRRQYPSAFISRPG